MPHLESISGSALGNLLLARGTHLDRPSLWSFDCDDTIVDHERGHHFVSAEVKQMMDQLRKRALCHIAINTARDSISYSPVGRSLEHDDPCLFNSGRVLRHQGLSGALKGAAFSRGVKEHLLSKLVEGICPFFEVRSLDGYYFLTSSVRNVDEHLGHPRPATWYRDLPKPAARNLEDKETCARFLDEDVVRLDAFFWRSQFPEICDAIDSSNIAPVEGAIKDLLIPGQEGVVFFAAPAKERAGDLGCLHIMMSPAQANKGLGLAELRARLNISEANILHFGDSSGSEGSDLAVKDHLPRSLLLAVENGDVRAKARADCTIGSVSSEGVPKAVACLLAHYDELQRAKKERELGQAGFEPATNGL